jgi:hypothetical protein
MIHVRKITECGHKLIECSRDKCRPADSRPPIHLLPGEAHRNIDDTTHASSSVPVVHSKALILPRLNLITFFLGSHESIATLRRLLQNVIGHARI